MTFVVYGLNRHELMPLEKLFDKRRVEKTVVINRVQTVDEKGHHAKQASKPASAAERAYGSIGDLPQEKPVLSASQIMVSPVITLSIKATVNEAIALFKTRRFRHVPVVSTEGDLAGIVSDRDVLRRISGITEEFEKSSEQNIMLQDQIMQLMKTSVLTASVDTDVRYIARLFVEQRVGSMPIVKDHRLKGIITRSDILRAVMQHYSLELWV